MNGREAIDRKFAQLPSLEPLARPHAGWVHALRQALGLTGAQLAARLGVSAPRIFALEQDEVRDAVTLATLRRAAEALDCTLVYALVPNRPLEQMVEEQSRKRAADLAKRVNMTMMLEQQQTSGAALKELEAGLAQRLRK